MISARHYAITTILALALVPLVGSSAYSADHEEQIDIHGVTWRMFNSQHLMVCLNGSASNSSGNSQPVVNTEMVALDLKGNAILAKELRAPVGGFDCVEIPYADLHPPRFDSDPIAESITFRIDIRRSVAPTTKTVVVDLPETNAAFMNIGSTGKTEQYLEFRLYAVKVTSYSVNGSGLD
jgi:hypothetical protein